LFFSEGIHSPFPKESVLIYEPFWQLGIVSNKDDHMKRLENLLGVESSSEERKQVRKRLDTQKQAVKEALEEGGSCMDWAICRRRTRLYGTCRNAAVNRKSGSTNHLWSAATT
ncbi:hypothetical protein, partial [Bacillus sp. JCM 19041]|uniref:hypothetical protein n=1 Tax=Bacillus sp. JCM 19041 TaxID=1460637 RepID=UPI00336A2B6E